MNYRFYLVGQLTSLHQPPYPPSPSGSALKQEDVPQVGPVGLRGKLHGTEHMLMVTTIMMAMMTMMKMTTMLMTTKVLKMTASPL